MKKLFSILVVGLMLAFGVNAAMACWGPQCYETDQFKNQAYTTDYGWSQTEKESYSKKGNDEASAYASGGASAEYEAYSGGKGFFVGNYATGQEETGSTSKAKTGAWDTGLQSGAYGEAKQVSFGNADACALGGEIGTGMAWTKTQANVDGYVYQDNYAAETGYASGTGAEAGNWSEAGYEGYAVDKDCYKGPIVWAAGSSVDLEGFAYTNGSSFVSVDPYGNTQSATGWTSNLSKAGVTGATEQSTFVNGGGMVNTNAFVTNAGSQGFSTFTYGGNDFGKGFAEHTSYATQDFGCYTNSASSGSSGSAWSFSK